MLNFISYNVINLNAVLLRLYSPIYPLYVSVFCYRWSTLNHMKYGCEWYIFFIIKVFFFFCGCSLKFYVIKLCI